MIGDVIILIVVFLISLVNWLLPTNLPFFSIETYKNLLENLMIFTFPFSILSKFLPVSLLLLMILAILGAEIIFIGIKLKFLSAKFVSKRG